ncbi:carbamoyl phosphate synthase-like protein [Moorella thermoacetica]|uniref:ATP-grasp domain-containing protein n=1 Tax=Moorella thermoacetica (strain ATCC 39073 / JCM 9320) TaxID=264732 RepID=Q2RKG8_MOOTA|nr:ATP-grasp domain-containing protein [Moorella thermoacetica]AKX93501.1 phosphoribosylamine--glycine ligase [Moorella thermoacetica]AKX96148.1 phosphoribosylamine--glycine ligase [Moorella thermoacetica]OIQ55360.1 phosphoribosylamine--glycine ligase [Moorella thermoacetica]QCZ99958.1 carbamoyl phosphate synthase-like protein [Moorella thermoacetica]TYL07388.1 Phosphoribosylamine--glycine ligase [Moorella thermoacetica]
MNILFTSAGRRVELIKLFQEVQEVDRVIAVDIGNTAPTLYCADKGFVIPKEGSDNYLDVLLEICRKYNIHMIIPLFDLELPFLSKLKETFHKEGVVVLISSPHVIEICLDKLQTAKFFNEHQIPTPLTYTPEDFLSRDIQGFDGQFIVKPRFGSSGKGVNKCNTKEEINYFIRQNETYIIQEFIRGYEVTLDVLCDFKGNCISIVPRKRLKVRGGEVERAVTIEAPNLLKITQEIVSKLNAVGPINIQCFITEQGPVFTEINPRFGGGYPLSYHAGADFPKMIVKMALGEKIAPRIGIYRRNLYMLRYDTAIYKGEDELIDQSCYL